MLMVQQGLCWRISRGEIEFKDVYFRYPARPKVEIFSGMSLKIPSGSTVALVGKSGSGKSTVINLLERFYDPYSGEVLIDGVNLKNLQVIYLLFATTIRDNIAYGKENSTEEEIKNALKFANVSDFVNGLPLVNYSLFPLSIQSKTIPFFM